MNNNLWLKDHTQNNFKQLNKNIKVSVAIVGGGIAGLLTAYLLKERGIDNVILEAKNIAMGITKDTTAKITSQHNIIYNKLIKTFGYENAQKYLIANELAVKSYKELCKDIDCDFNILPAVTYTLNNRKKIEDEVDAVNRLGGNASLIKSLDLPFEILCGIKFENQAQFNPLKFLNTISKNLIIYENTMVKKINKNILITDFGNVTADNIVITTHYPFINIRGLYFTKLYQQRSYVLALKNAQTIKGMYIDEDKNSLSFRSYKNLLLLGGKGNRTGKLAGGYESLRICKENLYPKSKEIYHWATQDCMTPDLVPYIGQFSKSTPNIFVATGFNKWGMTSAMVSANIISDMITGKVNDYSSIFSPSRPYLNKKQTYINIAESGKNLLTPSTKRCSHLGCALKYNALENTWDCPCHGSRFDYKGKLIDNPAMKDLH